MMTSRTYHETVDRQPAYSLTVTILQVRSGFFYQRTSSLFLGHIEQVLGIVCLWEHTYRTLPVSRKRITENFISHCY